MGDDPTRNALKAIGLKPIRSLPNPIFEIFIKNDPKLLNFKYFQEFTGKGLKTSFCRMLPQTKAGAFPGFGSMMLKKSMCQKVVRSQLSSNF